MRRATRSVFAAALVAGGAFVLSCGGGGNPGGPSPTSLPVPPPPVFIPLLQLFGQVSRPVEPWIKPSGWLVQLPSNGKLEARLDKWTPTEPNVELYIVKSPKSFPDFLTCVSYEVPCTGALAADTEPGKKNRKATTDVLQPNEYGVGVRNTSPIAADLSGEAGYYTVSVSVSTATGMVAAPVVGRFWAGADGNITFEAFK